MSSQQEWYLYDASGERVLRRSFDGTNTTLTVYAFGLEEHQYAYSGSGSTATTTGNTYYYDLGGQLLGPWDGSSPTTTFLLTDSLSSVVSSFNNPSSGAVMQGNQLYGPYGNQRLKQGSLSTNKGFTGQYNDGLTGLDYYHARYYDPTIGQFLSADTVQGNVGGMDPYSYVGGNPETRTDPTGMRMLGPNGETSWINPNGVQYVDTPSGGAQVITPLPSPFFYRPQPAKPPINPVAGAATVLKAARLATSAAKIFTAFATINEGSVIKGILNAFDALSWPIPINDIINGFLRPVKLHFGWRDVDQGSFLGKLNKLFGDGNASKVFESLDSVLAILSTAAYAVDLIQNYKDPEHVVEDLLGLGSGVLSFDIVKDFLAKYTGIDPEELSAIGFAMGALALAMQMADFVRDTLSDQGNTDRSKNQGGGGGGFPFPPSNILTPALLYPPE